MNKAIFLDRDGTINVDKDYLYKIEEFEFTDGAKEALKIFRKHGFKLILITNQSGIARGLYTETDFNRLTDWMISELNKSGIKIDGVYYCPHLADATVKKYRILCNCRKPSLGLFYKAIADFNIDLSESFSVGDKIRDLNICNSSDCKGYLVYNNERKEIIEKVKSGSYKNIKYADNILSCAEEISKMEKNN